MIRKRKSKTGEDANQEIDADLMEGNFPFTKKESVSKEVEPSLENTKKITSVNPVNPVNFVNPVTPINNVIPTNITTIETPKDQHEYVKLIENMENPIGDIIGLSGSKRLSRIGITNNVESEKNDPENKKDDIINKIYIKCDTETKEIIESFKFIQFSDLFRNPFNPTISKDEKIVRIFYLSGFCILPVLGWTIAIFYSMFCKEKHTNKKIISIKILSAIQTALVGMIICVVIFLLTTSDYSVNFCKSQNVITRTKFIKNSKYTVVFFGPIQTIDFMDSRLAKIAENFKFNICAIGFPNTEHSAIKSERHQFLKNALHCASLKPQDVVLFSYQLESANNYTIPYLEYNSNILGFFSFNKKFKRKNPLKKDPQKKYEVYLTPQNKIFYDIYNSIALNICKQDKQKKFVQTHYIVHHSFNKYHIRCSDKLTRDYNAVINNFSYNTTGDEEKPENHEESDFDEVVDDFHQFLAFIKDIISKNNIEYYKNLLCQNIMCEEKGVVCAF